MAGFLILLGACLFVIAVALKRRKLAAMSPEEREAPRLTRQHGPINPAMICPHCHEKGKVRTTQVDRKKGISGAKATGAILTAGVSVLATGLSRKERLTRAYCGNCANMWEF